MTKRELAVDTKPAVTRIYLVIEKHGEARRLVRAATKARALRHVAEDTLFVEVAKQDDLVSLGSDGVKVEETGAED